MKRLSNESVDQLRKNARSIVRELGLLNDAYFEIGVTLAERHLLLELNVCHRPTMGEIADRLLLDKSTISRLISKAVKKNYVECIIDPIDKRKRHLCMTEKGRLILNTFEPIAFNQTKGALLTLTNEEIKTVYEGVALYAKGLKQSRLKQQNCTDLESNKKIEILSEISARLDKLGYVLEPYRQEDEDGLYKIFQDVVDSGSQLPYECSSKQEFYSQFLNPQARVYVCRSLAGEICGGFYIKPNFTGSSKHIANAAYMIRETSRGKGIGSLVIKASLHFAKDLGFKAMQFNMVLSQNIIAIQIYQKLGFSILGAIPQAVRNSDETYASKHPHLDLHRKLTSQSLNELALPVDQKLIDTMKSKGWQIEIVRPGTDDYRYFTKYNIDASINTGVPKHILIKEGAPKSALLEEYLHGTQLKLGLLEKYGSREALEVHIKDFMIKHSKILGLDNPHDIKLLQQLKLEEIDRLNQARSLLW